MEEIHKTLINQFLEIKPKILNNPKLMEEWFENDPNKLEIILKNIEQDYKFFGYYEQQWRIKTLTYIGMNKEWPFCSYTVDCPFWESHTDTEVHISSLLNLIPLNPNLELHKKILKCIKSEFDLATKIDSLQAELIKKEDERNWRTLDGYYPEGSYLNSA